MYHRRSPQLRVMAPCHCRARGGASAKLFCVNSSHYDSFTVDLLLILFYSASSRDRCSRSLSFLQIFSLIDSFSCVATVQVKGEGQVSPTAQHYFAAGHTSSGRRLIFSGGGGGIFAAPPSSIKLRQTRGIFLVVVLEGAPPQVDWSPFHKFLSD